MSSHDPRAHLRLLRAASPLRETAEGTLFHGAPGAGARVVLALVPDELRASDCARALRDAGCFVCVARSERVASELASTFALDLVIVDGLEPGRAHELVRALRRSGQSTTPVVRLAGTSDPRPLLDSLVGQRTRAAN